MKYLVRDLAHAKRKASTAQEATDQYVASFAAVEATTPQEAANQYVAIFYPTPIMETTYHLYVWKAEGDYFATGTPAEPACLDGRKHEWNATSKDTGTISREVCSYCGLYKIIDMEAWNSATPVTNISYRGADEQSLKFRDADARRSA